MELKSESETNIQLLSFLQCNCDFTPPFEVTILRNNHVDDTVSGYKTIIDSSAIKTWSSNYSHSKTRLTFDEFKVLVRNALIQKDGYKLSIDNDNGSHVLTLWEVTGDVRCILGQHDLKQEKSSLALLTIGSSYLDHTKTDSSDLILENQLLKTTLIELTKEKASLEYLTYRSFTKLLNSKKRRINELETKVATLRNQNAGSGGIRNHDQKSNVKTKTTRSISSSSEEESSQVLYSKDTDIEDSDDPDRTLDPKDWRAKTPPKESPSKASGFNNVARRITKCDFDDSETDLSQSQSQENDSQYLLKPYGGSLPQENDCSNSNEGEDSKLKDEIEIQEGPSVSKRQKTDEDPDMDELLENL